MKLLHTWFNRPQRDSTGLRDHDGAMAKQLVAAGAVLVDVRSREEFASGRIAGALNIPHVEIDLRMHEIRSAQGNDPDKPVVVYCRSGGRSASAKRRMVAAGMQVLDLGTMFNWPR